ncbi:MAG: MarR family transcriptional regulator [Firmicutes bacterium]|nr:MarR family transcriptional regulator [Bacillota bacterium]
MSTINYDIMNIKNQLCFPLYAASKEVIRRYRPFLEKLDLTYTQYITMMIFWQDKKMNVKELGEKIFLDSGTLTPVLKNLEAKGYVKRYRSTEDERVLIVELTPEGEALKERAADIPKQVAECIDLSFEEAQQLHNLLNKLLLQITE